MKLKNENFMERHSIRQKINSQLAEDHEIQSL